MLWSDSALAAVYILIQDWSTPMTPVVQFFNIVLLVAAVGALAYFTTKLIGRGKIGSSGRNLQVIETIGVGPQSFIQILRVGTQYVLVGVTRGQITKLSELDSSQLTLPEPGQSVGFESFLSRFQKKDDDEGKGNNS